MKTKFSLIITALSVLMLSCSSKNDEPGPGPDPEPQGKVLFLDNFDSFNSQNWTAETHERGWVNHELQSYSPTNVTTGKDGNRTVLKITAKRKGSTFVSGRVNSKGNVKMNKGILEACIKLPSTANGLWPAFWMMGDNNKEWPACGEIDIMEMGAKVGIDGKAQDRMLNCAVHYGENAAKHEQQWATVSFNKSLQDGQYHIYKLVRDDKSLQIFIDDTKVTTFNLDEIPGTYLQGEFYILLNLAVGGDFTGILDASGITALQDEGSAEMCVDWIRITEL